MAKYILTIHKDYVSDWTVENAIRELLQNKIDQENDDPSNIGSIDVNGNTLTISNKTSKLNKSSLVLGNSSKRDNSKNIGKFGEGYKLALLVLLRNDIKVTIHNYYTKENWVPSIEYVKEYDSELLVINTSRYWFTSPPNNNLSFVISGLENIENKLKNILLYREEFSNIYKTRFGDILSGGAVGKIYVNGLFVSDLENLKFSYDIKPKYLKIGRDRNLVNSFDIKWVLADIWKEAPRDILIDAIKEGYEDVSCIEHKPYGITEVSKKLVESLEGKIPVANETDAQEAIKTYGKQVKTVIVTPTIKNLTRDYIQLPKPIKVKTNRELLEDFYKKHRRQFTKEMLKDWDILVNRLNKEN